MSEFCLIKYEINRRYCSEDNKYDSIKESKIKTQQKEEQIIKEIIERKIPVTSKMISNKIFNYISKRCHSPTCIGKIIDLSDLYDEKIKFDEWIKYNKELNQKIEEDILKILIDIFNKRYKYYPNNMCMLSPFAIQCKKNIELFCPKYYEISIYLLYVLNRQFIPFCKYIDENIDFKSISNVELENIKEILYYVGKDLKKIFKNALEDTYNFLFSSILIVILEEYLTKKNKKEEKKIKNSPMGKEKENFENSLKEIHNLYFKKEYEIDLIKMIKFGKEDKNRNTNEKIETNNNENSKEKNKNNKNINIDNNIKDKKEKKINDDKDDNRAIQNLNIDDLINFINEPKANDNNNKKKKKKKKKKDKKTEKNSKIAKVEIVEEDKDNINLDEDIDIINYKKSLEEFSNSVSDIKKRKPQYSEQFLKRLQML